MYLIADTHFDHRNQAGGTIISIEGRPFSSLEEMKRAIVNRWNQTVTKRDIVYHLGDFAWGSQQHIREILALLNGRKFLIIGNHDGTHSYKWWADVGFEFVSKHPIVVENKYILSHAPIEVPDGMYNIHGHVHSQTLDSLRHYNVSVENIGYMPRKFDTIKDLIKIRTLHNNTTMFSGMPW